MLNILQKFALVISSMSQSNSLYISVLSSNLLYISVISSNLLYTSTVQKDLNKTQEGDKEVRELAKNITMPTLIIWGQHDRVRPSN